MNVQFSATLEKVCAIVMELFKVYFYWITICSNLYYDCFVATLPIDYCNQKGSGHTNEGALIILLLTNTITKRTLFDDLQLATIDWNWMMEPIITRPQSSEA